MIINTYECLHVNTYRYISSTRQVSPRFGNYLHARMVYDYHQLDPHHPSPLRVNVHANSVHETRDRADPSPTSTSSSSLSMPSTTTTMSNTMTVKRMIKRRVLMVRTEMVVLYEGSRLMYVEQGKEDIFDTDTTGGSVRTDGISNGGGRTGSGKSGSGSSIGGVSNVGGSDRVTLSRMGSRNLVKERGDSYNASNHNHSNNHSNIRKNNDNSTITSDANVVRRRLLVKNEQLHDTSFRLRGSSSSSSSSSSSIPYLSASTSHRQAKRAPPGD